MIFVRLIALLIIGVTYISPLRVLIGRVESPVRTSY